MLKTSFWDIQLLAYYMLVYLLSWLELHYINSFWRRQTALRGLKNMFSIWCNRTLSFYPIMYNWNTCNFVIIQNSILIEIDFLSKGKDNLIWKFVMALHISNLFVIIVNIMNFNMENTFIFFLEHYLKESNLMTWNIYTNIKCHLVLSNNISL